MSYRMRCRIDSIKIFHLLWESHKVTNNPIIPFLQLIDFQDLSGSLSPTPSPTQLQLNFWHSAGQVTVWTHFLPLYLVEETHLICIHVFKMDQNYGLDSNESYKFTFRASSVLFIPFTLNRHLLSMPIRKAKCVMFFYICPSVGLTLFLLLESNFETVPYINF